MNKELLIKPVSKNIINKLLVIFSPFTTIHFH